MVLDNGLVNLPSWSDEAPPISQRDAEGGAGCLRPPIVVSVNPFHVCVHVDAGEASVVNMGVAPLRGVWLGIGDGLEAQIDADGVIVNTREAISDIDKAFKNLSANNARARSKFLPVLQAKSTPENVGADVRKSDSRPQANQA